MALSHRSLVIQPFKWDIWDLVCHFNILWIVKGFRVTSIFVDEIPLYHSQSVPTCHHPLLLPLWLWCALPRKEERRECGQTTKLQSKHVLFQRTDSSSCPKLHPAFLPSFLTHTDIAKLWKGHSLVSCVRPYNLGIGSHKKCCRCCDFLCLNGFTFTTVFLSPFGGPFEPRTKLFSLLLLGIWMTKYHFKPIVRKAIMFPLRVLNKLPSLETFYPKLRRSHWPHLLPSFLPSDFERPPLSRSNIDVEISGEWGRGRNLWLARWVELVAISW